MFLKTLEKCVEKWIRSGIFHVIHSFAKANNKYMADYDKSKESSCLNYLDVNNLYGLPMSQKLPVNNSEWIEDTSWFNEDVIKNYNEESDEGYFLKVDVQYREKLHELHNDLPFLSERMKFGKIKKLVTNLHETEYIIHIINSKQALNHGLVLKNVHRVIKFNQEDRLKRYIKIIKKTRSKK